ncbi:MAG: hypothetical protein GY899_11390 [Verrucomicrobiaceae bacterium]|nr:hypothetical protein [Verrucomicrobiaceae bacterium]
MRIFLTMALALTCSACRKPHEEQATHDVAPIEQIAKPALQEFIAQSEEFSSVLFTRLIAIATGTKVIPVSTTTSPDKAILDSIGNALDKSLADLNRDTSPIRQLRRINEASRFFEDSIASHINAKADFRCEHPKLANGKVQRSGYPDLQITHLPSGRICYLDPKLFESSNRKSTLRTFYYQPGTRYGKIHHDAHHLLAGIEHDGNNGSWRFTGWELVDLAGLELRLKAEFHGSNRDLYRDELLLRRSER